MAWACVACGSQKTDLLAITHATVIDMTGSPARSDQTVVVERQRIKAVGPSASVGVPDGAKVIDATGRFLIPGLADMHVHLTAAGEPDGSRKFIIPLLIANGITAVRDMGGKVEYLTQIRSEFNARDPRQLPRFGPQIFFTGPYLDGEDPSFLPSMVVTSAADAKKAVDDLAAQGVDFVKTQSVLSREAYFAIAEESKAKHIRFIGHVPDRVSALEASNARQASIEHLTGILLACSDKESELRQEQFAPDPPNSSSEQSAARMRAWQRKVLDSYSPQKVDALIRAFVANGTWQIPTFPILVHLAFVTPQTNLAADPRMKYVPQNERRIWEQGVQGQLANQPAAEFALHEELRKRSFEIVGKMHTGGVRFMAGTDMPAPNIFPGFSLHQDLAYLVQAGLSPMDALQSATRNPAEFLGTSKDAGTVEVGKYADLLLLDADPLRDIHNTQAIRAVVVRGRLLDRFALDTMLEGERAFASSH